MKRELADELLAMKKRDLDTRANLLEQGRLYGEYAPEMQRVHTENAQRLNEIVARYGWPGVSLAGFEGCRAAWLIAQHSICTPDLQRNFLALLAKACAVGDVPQHQVAFLTDRIRFNEGRPQRYGTVLDWKETGELSCEVEDPANLDARRREVGLPPFHEDLETHRKEVAAEGGNAPKEYAEYKRNAHAWAKSVGWVER
jgi:hypothetical protein